MRLVLSLLLAAYLVVVGPPASADSSSESWITYHRSGHAHFNATVHYAGSTPVVVTRLNYSVPDHWEDMHSACVHVTFRKWNGADVAGLPQQCITQANVSRYLEFPDVAIPGRRGRVRFTVQYDDHPPGKYGAVYVVRLT